MTEVKLVRQLKEFAHPAREGVSVVVERRGAAVTASFSEVCSVELADYALSQVLEMHAAADPAKVGAKRAVSNRRPFFVVADRQDTDTLTGVVETCCCMALDHDEE